MSSLPDLSTLSSAEKDVLILTLSARLDAALTLIAELQARIDDLTRPGKTPGNSSLPSKARSRTSRRSPTVQDHELAALAARAAAGR